MDLWRVPKCVLIGTWLCFKPQVAKPEGHTWALGGRRWGLCEVKGRGGVGVLLWFQEVGFNGGSEYKPEYSSLLIYSTTQVLVEGHESPLVVLSAGLAPKCAAIQEASTLNPVSDALKLIRVDVVAYHPSERGASEVVGFTSYVLTEHPYATSVE